MSEPQTMKPFQRGRYRAVPVLACGKTIYRIEVQAFAKWLPYAEGDKLVLLYASWIQAWQKVTELVRDEEREL